MSGSERDASSVPREQQVQIMVETPHSGILNQEGYQAL